MYCSKCGKQIDDDAMFCKFCGFNMKPEENEGKVLDIIEKKESRVYSRNSVSFDRDAFILYLKNVLDLQVAYTILHRRYINQKNAYDNRYAYYSKAADRKNHPSVPESRHSVTAWFLAIVGILGFIGFIKVLPGGGFKTFVCLCALIDSIIGIGWIISVHQENSERLKEYQWQYAEVERYNEKEQEDEKERKSHLNEIRNEWSKISSNYESEVNKIREIQNGFYDMNIIAKEYRHDLAALKYLYEVASTTQLSYEQICLQTKMEDGIRRINDNLNRVFEELEQILYETRCIREENCKYVNETIEQNSKMLERLESIETDSRLTAQYAELASNYSKANAYFSLATYLR